MGNTGSINVTKYSGETAPFDVEKLRQSLQRSGAKENVIDAVVKKVLQSLYEGISTQEIYKRAFALLRKKERPAAARYNLKRSEEHTSELQSRGHLVCRLLLEKKK